ncbi:MAG: alpha-ribazole transporter [Desulfobacteraceae bacterium]|nr:alpha-ribazole transporter [Desulfobacteraceae bacterium]
MNTNNPDRLKPSVMNVRRIARIAVFIALSAVGAMIKLPSPVGTIGLDSAPGFFCALAFGYVEGAAVIAMGHMLTSAVLGFPLGIPLHLFIAAQMALWAVALRLIRGRFGIIAGSTVTVLLNGVLSSFSMFFVGGMGAVLGIMPFLLAGSLVNVLIAALSYRVVHGGRLV